MSYSSKTSVTNLSLDHELDEAESGKPFSASNRN